MIRQSKYERALYFAKRDLPNGSPEEIKRAAKHYFVFFRKQENGKTTLIKENGKYKFINP